MSKSRRVPSLEHRAPIYVDRRGDYIDIQQPRGERTTYTPEEARAIAEEILDAAAAADSDGREEGE